MNKVANVILIQAVFVKKCLHFSWVNNKERLCWYVGLPAWC